MRFCSFLLVGLWVSTLASANPSHFKRWLGKRPVVQIEEYLIDTPLSLISDSESPPGKRHLTLSGDEGELTLRLTLNAQNQIETIATQRTKDGNKLPPYTTVLRPSLAVPADAPWDRAELRYYLVRNLSTQELMRSLRLTYWVDESRQRSLFIKLPASEPR